MTMKIGFITRLNRKTVLLRNLKRKYSGNPERKKNFVWYEERLFYIRMFRSAVERSMPMSAWTRLPRPMTP